MLYVIAIVAVAIIVTVYVLADEARQDARADNADEANHSRLGARYASYRYPVGLSEVYDAAYRWYRI